MSREIRDCARPVREVGCGDPGPSVALPRHQPDGVGGTVENIDPVEHLPGRQEILKCCRPAPDDLVLRYMVTTLTHASPDPGDVDRRMGSSQKHGGVS